MRYITFLKSLGRDHATVEAIRSELQESEVVYLDTSRIYARWLASELNMDDVISHSFFNGGEWEEVLVNHAKLGGDLSDLNAPLSRAIEEWNTLCRPDKHTGVLSL